MSKDNKYPQIKKNMKELQHNYDPEVKKGLRREGGTTIDIYNYMYITLYVYAAHLLFLDKC